MKKSKGCNKVIIRVLLASTDNDYITRLSDAMNRIPPTTGDVLEIALFTDVEKLKEKKEEGKFRFHVALVDENMASLVVGWAPVLMFFTENDALDNLPHSEIPTATVVYRYQRVSDMVNKLLLAQAKKHGYEGRGSGATCAFFSPTGGSGTSTVAVAFAIAAAASGIRPLYVSFEEFNSTGAFFDDSQGLNQGLYEVFVVIAEGGGVSTTVDIVKSDDTSGVSFLKKFGMWTEVSQITPDEIETFISGARSANTVDLVVLDLGSGISSFSDRVFECVDEVFLMTDANFPSSSQLKLDILLNEKSFFSNYIGKTNLVFNKSANKTSDTYGCKSVINIPNYKGTTIREIANMVSMNLRGLVREEWKPKNETN